MNRKDGMTGRRFSCVVMLAATIAIVAARRDREGGNRRVLGIRHEMP